MASFTSPDAMLKCIQECEHRNLDLDLSSTVHIPYRAAMYYAALLGLHDMVERLIDEGNDMNVVSYYGTPLVAACLYRHKDIVALLLARGADSSLAGSRAVGCPLAAAIGEGDLEIVKMLLAREEVDENCTRAPTALRCAVVGQETGGDIKSNSFSTWAASFLKDMGIIQWRWRDSCFDTSRDLKKISHASDSREIREGVPGQCNNRVDKSIPNVDDSFDTEYLETLAAESMIKVASSLLTRKRLEIVETLLDAGANPNIDMPPFVTALEYACLNGDEELLRLLLSRGASVGQRQGSMSALEAACSSGTLETVKILLAEDSDVNHRGFTTPLYVAVLRQRKEVAALLIKAGAKADLCNVGSYDNVLQLACSDGQYELARMLLEAGSDVNREGGVYGTPLYAACQAQDQKLVSLLLSKGADPNVRSSALCDNALQNMCRLGDDILVHLLLEHGADPNLHGGYYGSAFQAACFSGNESIVRMLVSKGVETKPNGGHFGNALEAAIESKNVNILKIVLECGLSANEERKGHTYPILQAAAIHHDNESHLEIIKVLLKHGADPNVSRKGDHKYALQWPTALHIANSESVADLLLDHGAAIEADPTGYGTPLLSNEIFNGVERYGRVSELLIKRGADVNAYHWNNVSPFGVACKNGKLQLARLMLDKGAKVDATDMMGRTPLLVATASSQLTVVGLLISSGANVSHEDRRGCTALHYAARMRIPELVEKILEVGADVNKVDDNGWSPLHWAMASSMKPGKAIKILLEAGANKNLKDKSGRSPLDYELYFRGPRAHASTTDQGFTTSFPRSDNGMNERDNDPQQKDTAENSSQVHRGSIDGNPRGQMLHYCDGCQIARRFCNRQGWHKCKSCVDFDFCPLCVASKDVTHFKDHEFTTEPEIIIEAPRKPKTNRWTKFDYSMCSLRPKSYRMTSKGYIWE